MEDNGIIFVKASPVTVVCFHVVIQLLQSPESTSTLVTGENLSLMCFFLMFPQVEGVSEFELAEVAREHGRRLLLGTCPSPRRHQETKLS